ncbi:MAG TPA: 3' terminal RNA ribose 2'-O-methyltransferase Hen1 [Kineosporiaceae bacterium]|nr:3' terminal RNA ribose 2'-O-methyltransferase Hen1 [Kineosporiaceae bacterium]
MDTTTVFLTITSTVASAAPTEATSTPTEPASAIDLGYLLHKHPSRAQSFDLPVGRAHVFYPEATAERCTAALLLEVDPIALVRGRRFAAPGAEAFSLAQYVNDRPYAASSMLAVALGKVYRTALAGRCDHRPELPDRRLALQIQIPALPCRGGPQVAERLFAPLGWQVAATPVPLDPELGWGPSRYVDLTLTGELRLADALNQLYVLLPVLDDAKHYWVSPDEVDKLIRAGTGWLAGHPERDLIMHRYLRHRRTLVTTATERLAELDDQPDTLVDDPADPPRIKVTLAEQRRDTVLAVLRSTGAASVVDLGCGEGKLLRALLDDPAYRRILGVDVSHHSLEVAARRLRLEQLPDRARERITLRQSSLTYRDPAVAGFDAAILMEVIEHIDPPRLGALQSSVFGAARPRAVIVTTPNVEYNTQFQLSEGATRHPDHRFEWTRAEFRSWADHVAAAHGYHVRFEPVGPEHPDLGPPTQLALFVRNPDE